jgi:predicted nucleic acid-binding protein
MQKKSKLFLAPKKSSIFVVSDSSPLILLAKTGRLNLIKELWNKVHIPKEVYNEVIVKGKKEAYGDAFVIEKEINNFIFIKELNVKYKREAEKLRGIIGSGESEAILLCLQEKADLFLIDNLEPRKIAEAKKIKCRSTPGVLLEALKKRIITFEDYDNSIKELAKHAWLSGDIIIYFLEAGYKLKNKLGDSK